jgi:multicomponent Na+:H+ antiporter subunit B
MKSDILKTAADYLLPVLLLFSVFILLRGHYLPGGGFVGGLMASIAFVLHAFAHGMDDTLKFMKYHPAIFIPIGLLISLLSCTAPLLVDKPVMTGLWFDTPLPVIGLIGSALFFDIGVYLVVVGATLTILFTISEITE